jgi:hypothetical protein
MTGGSRTSKHFETIHDALKFTFKLKMYELHELYKVE